MTDTAFSPSTPGPRIENLEEPYRGDTVTPLCVDTSAEDRAVPFQPIRRGAASECIHSRSRNLLYIVARKGLVTAEKQLR